MAARSLPTDTVALIVGGGPVGLIMSALLRAHGVDHVVIERRGDVQAAPAAHVVNARTFEIMRSAGIDMDAVWAMCRPAADGWVRWVTTLTGDELGFVPFELQDRIDTLDHITPTPLRNLSQHRLEPILRTHVGDSLAAGIEWVEAVESDEFVTSIVRDVATGATSQIRSTYLIGADGAGSPVRRSTAITMEGPPRLQTFLGIHVEVDLRAVVAHRPATLYWILEPDVGGTFIAHDIDGDWVYMQAFDPDTEQLSDYTPERCAEIFRRAVGTDIGEFTVRGVAPWNMSCQVASNYREGNTFLIGDAAHRFPPTGGMGLNTGVADAHNLAWKIAAVEHGWGAPSLLNTYDAERRPVAQTNAAQSLDNAMKLFEVVMALGIDADPEVTRRNYTEAVTTPEGRARVRAAAEAQAPHFDMLGLQLGYAYAPDGGLVIDDGTQAVAPADPVRDYVPTTRPGGRLPHAWVERDGGAVSTLDLVPTGRFLLLTSSAAWAAVGQALVAGDVPLDVATVPAEALEGAAVLVRPDQHVAWRAAHEPGADAATVLAGALTALSGHRG